jgi:hypothetical protein
MDINKSDAQDHIETLIRNILIAEINTSPAIRESVIANIVRSLGDDDNVWAVSEFVAEKVNANLPDVPVNWNQEWDIK